MSGLNVECPQEEPALRIGPFTLSRSYALHEAKSRVPMVMIQHESGEAGRFREADLAEWLGMFWDEQF